MGDDRYLHLIRRDCPLPPGSHVIAYCRDSGGEEQERSVKQQWQAIEEYCRHHELILEHIYADESRTGADASRRAGLQDMLRDLTERFPQIRQLKKRQEWMDENHFGLIAWKSARLGRDSIETTLIKADIRVRGIVIVSLVAGVSTGDPAVDAMLEMFEQYRDERLLDDIAEQSRRGLADIVGMRDDDAEFLAYNPGWTSTGAYLGIMPGPLPRGFRGEHVVIGVHKRKSGGEKRLVRRIVPNHEDNEWERCALAWKMRLEGDGIKKIMQATRLYKGTSGYDHFFENRIYTGDLLYGGHLYENFVPALISREDFDREQAARGERVKKQQKGSKTDPAHEPRRIASDYLLSGLVFCGAVEGQEHPMVGDANAPKNGRRWRYYMCTHRKNTREAACQQPRVSAVALEMSVVRTLLDRVLTAERLQPLTRAIAASLNERNKDAALRLETAQAALSEAERHAARILDAIEQIGVTQQLRERLAQREAEMRSLKIEIAQLEQLIVRDEQLDAVSDAQLEEWIDNIRAALMGSDKALARQAVNAFVTKVVLVGKEGTIYFTFPFDDNPRIRAMTPSGSRTYPPQFGGTEPFRCRRAPGTSRKLPETQEHAALRAQVKAMRAQDMSYPTIARALGISLSRAWLLGQD